MSCNKESERTIRLRENKRRNRARQKEYTADLERRLRQFEQEGVRATIEVQSAARQVAEENIHLRELLRALGVDGSIVNDWIARRKSSRNLKGNGQSHCRRSGPNPGICINSKEGETGPESETPCSSSSQPQCSQSRHTNCQMRSPPLSIGSLPALESVGQVSSTTENPISNRPSPAGSNTPSTDTKKETTTEHHEDQTPSDPNLPSSSPFHPLQSAPCKLLTRLTANPTSDISNLLAAPTTAPVPEFDTDTTITAEDGLPCESAYKLLMQYATSDEKLDALARTLESGCVPNSGGGCKVRNETVSQALLDICL